MVKNLLFAITAICVIACSTSKTSSKTKLYKRNHETDLVKDSLDLEISKVNIDSIRYHKDSCATLVLRNGASVNIKNHLLFEDTIKFKSCDTAFNFPQVVAKKEEFESREFLPLSLSYDHRVINGVYAAQFVTQLGSALGDTLLMEKNFK